MEKATLFQTQLDDVLGDCGYKKPLLWISSIGSGMIMSKLAFELMKALGPRLFPNAYTKLSDKDRIEWNNRAISFTHAIVSSIVAGYLFFVSDLFRDEAAYGPVVFRSTIFTMFFLGVSNGYFITDMAMLLTYYPNLGEKEFVVHHAVSIISLFLALHSGYAHIYLYTVLMSESTTPFINIRWYLAAADMKNTRAYTINGIFLFVSWLWRKATMHVGAENLPLPVDAEQVARIFLFVYVFLHMYWHYDEVREIDTVGYYFMLISTSVFAMMNLYWFEKIARGLIKVLKSKDS